MNAPSPGPATRNSDVPPLVLRALFTAVNIALAVTARGPRRLRPFDLPRRLHRRLRLVRWWERRWLAFGRTLQTLT